MNTLELCRCFLFWLALSSGAAAVWAAESVELRLLDDDNWEQSVPEGKEVDAILGDVVLRNRFVTAVIAQPLASRHANMTVRDVAGCLLDWTTRDRGSDQLSAYYPGGRQPVFRDWKFLNDQNQSIEVSPKGTSSNTSLAVQVVSVGTADRPALTVTYQLRADQPWLMVTQTYQNEATSPVTFTLEDQIRLDGGKEDQLKSPNGTHSLYWIDDRYWKQAYGWAAEGYQTVSRSDARTSTLKYSPERSGTGTEITLQPGEQLEVKLKLYVADQLCEIRAEHEKTSLSPTVITIAGRENLVPGARVELMSSGEYYGTLWTDGSGRIDQKLKAGDYEARLSWLGFPLREQLALKVLPGDNQFDLQTELGMGVLKIKVTDDKNNPLPCKVELLRRDLEWSPDFGPESATIGVKNLRYLVDGQDQLLLPEGEYSAIISHGPEYDASFQDFQLTSQSENELTAKLPHVVDTSGWISAEFHSHSSPSGDNTGSQRGRVLNLICEHLEFAPCTEHNRIDTYQPHLQALGMFDQLATCTGMELTGKPLPLNHQNAFPLIHRPRTQDGGGPTPDESPEIQIQRLALWDQRSEKLIQQNHPDFGWLFRDKNGDGEADKGFEESFPYIDAVEVHPLASILIDPSMAGDNSNQKLRMIHWLQLLNQGYRMTGVVNTDAHYNFHGSGGLRNWIRSQTDLPGEIQPLDIVAATKQGQVVMSNGPFLTVTAQKPGESSSPAAGPGDELTISGDVVQLELNVQCPNWFTIDRVFVLINGKAVPELNFRKSEHPELFTEDVIRFSHQVRTTLTADAHLIAVAAGEHSQLGPVMGPVFGLHQPVAVANPIFVDTDGNGFQPSQQTLEFPLPVKQK